MRFFSPLFLAVALCLGLSHRASAITVNNLSDTDGTCGLAACSLREAIKAANRQAGPDIITFAEQLDGTIVLGSSLPTINTDLTIKVPFEVHIALDAQGQNRIFSVSNATVAISDLAITNGYSSDKGGALSTSTTATLTLSGCTFSGNNASGELGGGGAIYNAGNLTVRNCTFANNSANGASGDGGAILNAGTLAISSATLTANSATRYGGGIASADFQLDNSIVAGNSAGDDGPEIYGSVAGDYNLVQNPSGATLSSSHDILGQDPRLVELVSNAGPTPTFDLYPDSPAIDAGNASGVDQRGLARPYDKADVPNVANGSDIGALEKDAFDFPQDPQNSGIALLVNTLDDHNDGACGVNDCSLREAINAANSDAGHTSIAFVPSLNGTILLQSSLPTINTKINLGTGSKNRITLDGQNLYQILTIENGVAPNNVGIYGFTIARGKSGVNGGAITNSSDNLSVFQCTFIDNHADNNGGAIYNNGAYMFISLCTLANNSAGNRGGGIYIVAGKRLQMNGCTLSQNSADSAGGIYCASGTLDLNNSIVAGNSANAFGPDIYGAVQYAAYNLVQDMSGTSLPGTNNIKGQDPLLLPLADNGGLTFTFALPANSPAIDASNFGGIDQRGQMRPIDIAGVPNVTDGSDIGAYELDISQSGAPAFLVNTLDDHDDSTCGISDCSLREAVKAAAKQAGEDTITFAPGLSGTILIRGGQLVMELNDVTIAASLDAPITLDGQRNARIFSIGRSSVVLSGFTLTNASSIEGGAIYNAGVLTVNNCTFSKNVAQFGAAIYNPTGQVAITNCTFTGNVANFGGAILNQNAMEITNGTFSGNISNQGGAISNNGTLTVTSCTISGNNATMQPTSGVGGGIYNASTLYLSNSIVAGNNASSTGPDIDGAVSNASYNLIQRITNTTFNSGSNNITGKAPGLAALGNNGGPTQTFALLTTSPALNAGDPTFDTTVTSYDQRGPGYLRKKDKAIDIGAFEFQDVAPSNILLNQSFVPEKQPAGTYVGSFITVDPDPDETFTYTFATGTGATDNAQFTINGPSLRTSAVFDAAVKNRYNIRVKSTDSKGLSFTQVFIIKVSESSPPTITLSSPVLNQKVLIRDFDGNLICGTATDNIGVTAVKVRLSRKRNNGNTFWNGSAFGPLPLYVDAVVTGSTSATWKLVNIPPVNKLDSGSYQIQVYALDNADNKSPLVAQTFILGTDFQAPEVNISTPTPNQKININALSAGTLTGTATDDTGVTRVTLKLQRKRGTAYEYWNGTVFVTSPITFDATVIRGTSATWSYNTAIPASALDAGSYILYATAIDAAGNQKTSASRSFTINGTPSSAATVSASDNSAGSS